MSNYCVGRQPIFDAEMNLFAYELLFRSDPDRQEPFDGDKATSQIILDSFTEVGLNTLVGDHLAFVNLTRQFVTDDGLLTFPPGRVVLEILEDIEPDQELIDASMQLAERGYTIALDDFVYRDVYEAMLDIAKIVKIDVLALSMDEVARQIELIRRPNIRLLAEKVETRAQYEQLKSMGFEYFQGYFLSRPQIVQGRRLPTNKVAILQLISKVSDPDIEIDELESLISRDVGMSVKSLRFVNSAASGINRTIESIREAVLYLGRNTIKNWVMLMALTRIDDKPVELMTTALVRARFCELLASSAGKPGKDVYFTVGLFSILDAMMDRPIDEILDSLPVSDDIINAILQHRGDYGAALRCALNLEWGISDKLEFNQLGWHDIAQLYAPALNWADESLNLL